MSIFSKLFGALKKTKDSLAGKLAALFRGDYFADEFYEELEDILISSDISVSTAEEIIEDLRERVKEEKLKDEAFVRQALRDSFLFGF